MRPAGGKQFGQDRTRARRPSLRLAERHNERNRIGAPCPSAENRAERCPSRLHVRFDCAGRRTDPVEGAGDLGGYPKRRHTRAIRLQGPAQPRRPSPPCRSTGSLASGEAASAVQLASGGSHGLRVAGELARTQPPAAAPRISPHALQTHTAVVPAGERYQFGHAVCSMTAASQ